MKQKLIVLLLLVVCACLSLFAYWSYAQQRAVLQQLQKDVQLGQRQLTELNDQLAALSRQQRGQPGIAGLLGDNTGASSGLNAAQQLQLEMQRSEVRQLKLQWLQANLQLAQDASLKARFDTAVLLLQETRQHILQSRDTQDDPLNLALLQAIKNDQQQITQNMQHYREVQLGLDRALSSLQQQLLQDTRIKLGKSKGAAEQQESGLAAWFSNILVVQRIAPETQQLALDRSFVYKQISMLVSLSRQAVAENDQAALANYLQDMLDALQPLADAQSKAVRSSIVSLQQQRLPMADSLTALALLSHQKAAL